MHSVRQHRDFIECERNEFRSSCSPPVMVMVVVMMPRRDGRSGIMDVRAASPRPVARGRRRIDDHGWGINRRRRVLRITEVSTGARQPKAESPIAGLNRRIMPGCECGDHDRRCQRRESKSFHPASFQIPRVRRGPFRLQAPCFPANDSQRIPKKLYTVQIIHGARCVGRVEPRGTRPPKPNA